MDRILLEGMSFQGRHGVRPAERERPQEFKVDIEVDCDLSEPGKSDRTRRSLYFFDDETTTPLWEYQAWRLSA